MTARIVGLGIIAPTGNNTEAYWEATLDKRNGIGELTKFDATRYPSTLAGEIQNFDFQRWIPSKLMPQTDNMTRYALYAADQALQDADHDFDEFSDFDIGVFTSASGGAVEFGQRELQNLWAKGKDHVSAYQAFAWFYAVNTGQISIKNNTKGSAGVILSEQCGGIDAISWADRKIKRGLKFALSGGVDSALSPWGYVPQMASGKMSTSSNADTAYQPFGTQASGYITGEGGAILALASTDNDARENTKDYGRIVGHASTFGATSESLAECITQALQRAQLRSSDIDLVFADGAGNPGDDKAEEASLVQVFGDTPPPITIPKTSTGRLLAGAGALDTATACLALKHQTIPPSRCDYDIDTTLPIATKPQRADLRNILVIARGHGGFNSAIIISNN